MRFTLLQWNIDYTEPIERIARQIKQWQPDVVCLQEVTLGWQPEHSDTMAFLAKTLGLRYEAAYGLMTLPSGEPTHMGVGILGRFPIVGSQRIATQSGLVKDGKVLRDERYYLECALDIRGQQVAVGTVHLPFHPRFQTTPNKQAMAEKLVQHRATITGDYILAGDLNTTPGSKAALILRHSLRNAGPALTTKTWTKKPFVIGPWSYQEMQWRLDYVLYKPGSKLKAHKAQAQTTPLSDHVPLLARFELSQ